MASHGDEPGTVIRAGDGFRGMIASFCVPARATVDSFVVACNICPNGDCLLSRAVSRRTDVCVHAPRRAKR